MGGGGPISDIADAVGDVVEGVGDVVSDVGSFIDDAVIQPALDDPIKTAATIGAVAVGGPAVAGALGTSAATGAAIAGGLATAGGALASGADVEDALKAGAIGAAGGAAGGALGQSVGSAVAGQTGSNIAGQIAGNIAGGAASGGTQAALTGGDIGQGLLLGGASGGISAGVNTAFNAGANLLRGSNFASNALQGQGTTMGDNIQIFDDGSSIQTFDDGSAIVTDFNGGTFVLDTNSGYAQAVNSTGQPIGQATSGLFDSILSGAKSVATSALKQLLLGGNRVTGQTAGGLARQNAMQPTGGGLLGAGVNYLLSEQARKAIQESAKQAAGEQRAATQQAVNLARFTPVGVTTAFGTAQYQVDPTTGQITQAGYTSTPALQAAQERLLSSGSSMIPTGNLQEQAQNIFAQQQGLLAPGREQQLAQLRNRTFQTGRSGLATGGTMAGYSPNAQGLMATNPEMAAYYNALAQQDAQLAAASQQQALAQAAGQAQLSSSLFGQAGTLEGLAQQPLSLGSALAQQQATAGARAGQLGLLGGSAATQTQLQGNIASATGQLGQQQALASAVNPLLQSVGNSFLNWIG